VGTVDFVVCTVGRVEISSMLLERSLASIDEPLVSHNPNQSVSQRIVFPLDQLIFHSVPVEWKLNVVDCPRRRILYQNHLIPA
jgi:hypothetical protein